MKKIILLISLLSFSTLSKAQDLSFEQLEQMLNSTIDEAEENLFLLGYPFISKMALPDSIGMVYNFSNRKNTIKTAKKVSKAFYYKEPNKGLIKYISYDRNEFYRFRRLMTEYQFTRNSKDSISENSHYSKGTMKVDFEVENDEQQNKSYIITMQNYRTNAVNKIPKKLNLRGLFNQQVF